MRKSEVLSFKTTLRPARPLRASWAATRSLSLLATSRSFSADPVSWRNVVSAEMLLVGPPGRDAAVVLAVGVKGEALAELAEARDQLRLRQRLQVGDGLESALLHAPRGDGADAVDLAHRQRREKALRFEPRR